MNGATRSAIGVAPRALFAVSGTVHSKFISHNALRASFLLMFQTNIVLHSSSLIVHLTLIPHLPLLALLSRQISLLSWRTSSGEHLHKPRGRVVRRRGPLLLLPRPPRLILLHINSPGCRDKPVQEVLRPVDHMLGNTAPRLVSASASSPRQRHALLLTTSAPSYTPPPTCP